jgi:hypothetical protein
VGLMQLSQGGVDHIGQIWNKPLARIHAWWRHASEYGDRLLVRKIATYGHPERMEFDAGSHIVVVVNYLSAEMLANSYLGQYNKVYLDCECTGALFLAF